MRDINRPLLLGMNQPVAGATPLDPTILGSAGHRLYQMLNAYRETTLEAYESAFERANVLDGTEWSADRARASGVAAQARLRGRRVVLLGRAVLVSLRLPAVPLADRWGATWYTNQITFMPEPNSTFYYCPIPHPSGLCHSYNDPGVRLVVGRLLWGLMSGG